jgi:hypothetical protein
MLLKYNINLPQSISENIPLYRNLEYYHLKLNISVLALVFSESSKYIAIYLFVIFYLLCYDRVVEK